MAAFDVVRTDDDIAERDREIDMFCRAGVLFTGQNGGFDALGGGTVQKELGAGCAGHGAEFQLAHRDTAAGLAGFRRKYALCFTPRPGADFCFPIVLLSTSVTFYSVEFQKDVGDACTAPART